MVTLVLPIGDVDFILDVHNFIIDITYSYASLSYFNVMSLKTLMK